jgi:L-threonylcarbamoyladenylate synthase
MRMRTSSRRVEVFSIDPCRPSWPLIRRVAQRIRCGEVVAVPTDTVYGLAADPFREGAAERIFEIKRRPESNPILLLIDSLEQLNEVASDLPPTFRRIAAAFWPGPLTIVVPASPRVPSAITAGTGTVAVRLPAAPLIRRLIRASGCPLTGTSANLSGSPAATSANEVKRQLRGRVYHIVDGGNVDGGRSRLSQPSTILDLTSEPRIVRQGAVSWAELAKYLA